MSSDSHEQHVSIDPNSVTAGYELHDVNVPILIAFSAVCVITIVISVVCLDSYFSYYREQLIREANDYGTPALSELRAYEEEQLNRYGVIDKEKGIYQIPVSRAMAILAEEAFQQQGTAP